MQDCNVERAVLQYRCGRIELSTNKNKFAGPSVLQAWAFPAQRAMIRTLTLRNIAFILMILVVSGSLVPETAQGPEPELQNSDNGLVGKTLSFMSDLEGQGA